MDNVWERVYVTEGEVVDTYGGDYTYRDTWYVIVNGEKEYYQQCYGAKPDAEPVRLYDISYYETND